jgi:hypothetical protein
VNVVFVLSFFSDHHPTKETKGQRSGLFFVAVLGLPTATSRWGQPSDGRETMTSNENSRVSGLLLFLLDEGHEKKGGVKGAGDERGGLYKGHGDHARRMGGRWWVT